MNNQYMSCFFCDNIVCRDGEVGLLHLEYPRCFVITLDDSDFWLSDYDYWLSRSVVNWLDEDGTEEERDEVLAKLWNFSILQEEEEERRFSLRSDEIL